MFAISAEKILNHCRKRATSLPDEANQEAKKPRLEKDDNDLQAGKTTIEDTFEFAAIAVDGVNDVVLETTAIETTPADEAATEHSKREKARRKKHDTSGDDGGGVFKEHPYTFLPPTDPILKNCM